MAILLFALPLPAMIPVGTRLRARLAGRGFQHAVVGRAPSRSGAALVLRVL